MKARVKATGEIVEVDFDTVTIKGKQFGVVTDTKRLCKPCRDYRKFYQDELEFISPVDTEVVDYWEKLKHQYAGMAMQGILSNEDYCKVLLDGVNEWSFAERVASASKDFATTLVEKLKKR